MYLSNIKITPTYIWEGVSNSVALEAIIDNETQISVKYQILLNNNKIYPSDDEYTPLAPTPINVNLSIDYQEFLSGENILQIIVVDDQDNQISWEYSIYGENKDTLNFIRRYDFKDHWHLSDPNKINISLENKLQLNEYGKAYVRSTDLSNIRTDGKAYINQIIVNGTEDKSFDIARLKMNYAGQLGEGHLFRKKIDVDFYKYLRFL